MTFRVSKKEARQLGIIPPQAKSMSYASYPPQYSPMNNLERDYAAYLEQLKMVGQPYLSPEMIVDQLCTICKKNVTVSHAKYRHSLF